MSLVQVKRIILFALILISVVGVWAHSFEHIEHNDQENCVYLIAGNVSSAESSVAFNWETVFPTTRQFNLPSIQSICLAGEKHPYKNKAPPVS